ncbi:hypothetical protein F5144DRAFT_570646 [Chaetomium tenue]|uniref:Uncharacterized protein n=1 Tax=Chaetomium tenue TaxID=1854479 RepID=A0ACB7P520_9PEZI|nr:hypothetical protein F5144DRAFT_570646 [Chaetomium globosum]
MTWLNPRVSALGVLVLYHGEVLGPVSFRGQRPRGKERERKEDTRAKVSASMLEIKAHSHVSGGNVTGVECQGTLYVEGRRMAFCGSLRPSNLEWENQTTVPETEWGGHP